MSDVKEKGNQIRLFEDSSGNFQLDVLVEEETVWLSLEQMGLLFGKSKSTVNEHILNIYSEGELEENNTTRKIGISELSTKPTNFYNLDVIISVGYRVKSPQGIAFRKWATKTLKEYAVKGFILDQERLEEGRGKKDYFDELEERIRAIRTSERNMYEKVKALFSTSIDYLSNSDVASKFYSIVQNKFEFAIVGLTSAETVVSRINNNPDMNYGLTNWEGMKMGGQITLKDALVAKNFFTELELRQLRLLSEQFLSFAELRVIRRVPTTMAEWLTKLDEFLNLNELNVLDNAGTVSVDMKKAIVKKMLQEGREKKKLETKQTAPIKKPSKVKKVSKLTETEFDQILKGAKSE